MTYITHYRAYEFFIMLFRLANAPAIYSILTNKIFYPYLDNIMVIYLDNIIIYSNTMKEHVEHLRIVVKVLKNNDFYIKREKCLSDNRITVS